VLSQPPLIVDLDGTLVLTDMLHESALRLMRDRPWQVAMIPFWLLKGKASLKEKLASGTEFEVNTLPYNLDLIDWLKTQKSLGRQVILCTASDKSIANKIATHVGLFDEVIASDGNENLAGKKKAETLVKRFGEKGFDYAGNADVDLFVWEQTRNAIVVNGKAGLAEKASRVCAVEKVLPGPTVTLSVLRRMFRVHQWLKNLLLFVPLFAAHEVGNFQSWGLLIMAFVSFSLCASSVYIANDLLDLESDRLHVRKRVRPFAAGVMPIWAGVLIAPILLIVSLLIGSFVGTAFLAWLIFYFLLTCVYSWSLKRIVLVDCLALATLYTLRVLAGAATVGHQLSFWLLAFSVFLFLSLAFVKRYAELNLQVASGKSKVHGRGYHTDDAVVIQTMGIVAGYASVLVLALYVNSESVTRLYAAPYAIWGAIPVVLFWVSWMWIKAHRGEMNDDPLVFAVKDKVSLIAGMCFAIVLVIGTLGISWLK
jgi:4-hydroxybenzoate polyprenyltransferase/phosphoserine phosphatase